MAFTKKPLLHFSEIAKVTLLKRHTKQKKLKYNLKT